MLWTNLLTMNKSQNFHHEQYGKKMKEVQEEEDWDYSKSFSASAPATISNISPVIFAWRSRL